MIVAPAELPIGIITAVIGAPVFLHLCHPTRRSPFGAMICARSLSFAAGKRKLVDGIDLDLVPGRFIAVVGPNGAGKSTLLRLLTGELKPTSGQVLIGNRELNSFSADQLARRRAVLAQHTALAVPFTALEVVLLGMTVQGCRPKLATRQVAFTMLERLGLDNWLGGPIRPYLAANGSGYIWRTVPA